MILRRENLPAMKTVEAGRIGERRSSDVLESTEEEACFAWLHRASGRASPLWLCAAPREEAGQAHELWSRLGIDVELLGSRQLALGNLVRVLPESAAPGPTALLDLDNDRGICVLADSEGWVFGRKFTLLEVGDPGPEPGEEEGESSEESFEWPVLIDIWAMRLATELRRTFRYVDGELALGSVTRIYVMGASSRIAEICPQLSHRLEMPVLPLSEALFDGPARGVPDAAAAALGLALWPSEEGGNLLPRKLKRERARVFARHQLHLVFACVATILTLATGLWILKRANQEAQLRTLETQLGATSEQRALVAEHASVRQGVTALDQAIARIDRPLPALSGLLTLLSRLTPDEAHVERMRVTREPEGWILSLDVEAGGEDVAAAARAISGLADALRATPLLEFDRIVQNDVALQADLRGPAVRVHFRLEGRLAPVSEATTTPFEGRRAGAAAGASKVGRSDA